MRMQVVIMEEGCVWGSRIVGRKWGVTSSKAQCSLYRLTAFSLFFSDQRNCPSFSDSSTQSPNTITCNTTPHPCQPPSITRRPGIPLLVHPHLSPNFFTPPSSVISLYYQSNSQILTRFPYYSPRYPANISSHNSAHTWSVNRLYV